MGDRLSIWQTHERCTRYKQLYKQLFSGVVIALEPIIVQNIIPIPDFGSWDS